jgi:ATP-binding cassette subfamily A (ABC1) protein 3
MWLPINIVLNIPNVISFTSRMILRGIVHDKQTKMKETLKLMSLTQFSYGMSYFMLQAFYGVLSGFLMTVLLLGNSMMFENDPWKSSGLFMLTVIIYNVNTCSFCMALSTLFNETETAGQVGGVLTLIPSIFFLQFT